MKSNFSNQPDASVEFRPARCGTACAGGVAEPSRIGRDGTTNGGAAPPRGRRAFSLLEVMIAIAILFIGTFAILGLISSSLANARRLQRPLVDASALVSQLSMTNKLVEGIYSGNLSDVLGKEYSDYKWTGEIREVQSNRLFQADFVIQNARGSSDIISRTTTLFFRPESPPGILDGGKFGQ